MEIKSKLDKSRIYVYFSGEIDEHSANKARATIDNVLENNNFKVVIFDFSNTSFMDSTGIGMLLGRYKKLKKRGVSSYISNPSFSVNKVFQISGIYDVMPKI
ncbi:MAG: anti-sigma factor antagonist [Clostridia bacterium]|nr:anti-sigma factor antagonist [Clostridia bacterium]